MCNIPDPITYFLTVYPAAPLCTEPETFPCPECGHDANLTAWCAHYESFECANCTFTFSVQ